MGDADALTLPLQRTVFVIQREALAHDEAIRLRVTQAGFRIVDQTLVNLTADRAATYYYDKLLKPEDAAKKTGGRTARGAPTGRGGTAASTSARKDGGPPSSPPSPRDKTPRPSDDPSPRVGTASPGKTPRDVGETADDAIAALSSGPIVVLLLEKQNAVKAMLDLVGPQNPAQWASNPTCLRATFAQDGKHVGVRSSRFPYNVSDEVAFLFAHSGANAGKQADGDLAADDAGKAMVHLDALMSFLFPPNIQHPNSTGRLFVFSLYGPLDAKSRLRSGEKGLHVVTDIELNTMCASIEREDILSVYGMIGLSQDEEEQVLRQADKYMKHLPRHTRSDIEELFRLVPRSNDGAMSFHAMQTRIMEERIRRVLCMKDKLNTALAPPIVSKYRKSLSRCDPMDISIV
ncbi:hypothetical protein, variant 1 [Aphanomyces invadans]|uniref:Nucleoside diphosphate kinase-like domain-containing protein n=1 Tax=Aphanomyces invadans TaxID=157072 RepID=A0A024T7Z8_9STRA|nr:hypothetical protein, variant 1 [Aphanomyces invadans]ETV90170.1 hypothetical protein, variant 1 [Aphanomyces invadans]|eukprot:XP_008881200.1 hypothetical protein, variant 1 [Aphanomyces invadans]